MFHVILTFVFCVINLTCFMLKPNKLKLFIFPIIVLIGVYNMSDLNEIPGVNKLLNSRRGYKASITTSINKLSNSDFSIIPQNFFESQNKLINQWILKIDAINNEIFQLGAENSIDVNLESELKYIAGIHMKLADISKAIDDESVPESINNVSVDLFNNSIAEAISNMQNNALVPKMNCQKFSGKNVDKFDFKNFLTNFQNCTANIRSDALKLSYLRSLLTDYAFAIISHLTINEPNYNIAIDLLKNEFLDNNFIIDEIFSQLIKSFPKYDPEFVSVKQFLAKARADLYELNSSFGLDFITENTPGNYLVSHLIFNKLPNILKRELVRFSNSNYPTLKDIFDNYQHIIRTIIKTSSKRPEVAQNGSKMYLPKSNNKVKELNNDYNNPTLENFSTNTDMTFYCKFCATRGHSMVNCTKYNNYDSRIKKCRELNMCEKCTSIKHKSRECFGNLSFPCKFCKSKEHISATCNKFKNIESVSSNLCLNAGIQENLFLLPIVEVSVSNGKFNHSFNCLLDTGSQRSYFSEKILNKLKIDTINLNNVSYNVKTFVSSQVKNLKEIMLNVKVAGNNFLPLPILIDNSFEISFNITDLNKALMNFREKNIKLAAKYEHSDEISVNGLIGCDYIQFIQPFEQISLMNGSALKLPCGICPFGNIIHFLKKNQISPIKPQDNFLNYNSIISKYASCTNTQINYVLNPVKSYEDPFGEIFDECDVERKIDNMLNLNDEKNSDISNFDKLKLDEFDKSIEFKNDCYFVKLPWINDKLKHVKSNYNIALAVLDRVVSKLKQQNLFNEYLDIFHQQETEGIIERFYVQPEEFHKFVWIPHRPIIREGKQITTKVRAVYNCSLKTKGNLSLNDAAYPGINLLRDLTELLIYFRTNKYVMLGDIRKAFLMIRLSSEEDKSKFCFFMYENNKLITFRFNTILFGFNASPFILNYIIKHHLKKFSDDKCNEMLNKCLYVDNLIYTSNDVNQLINLYRESINRMDKGGFNLRSWNSNNKELQEIMKHDEKYVTHGLVEEKVLGYKYNVGLDNISIFYNSVSLNVNSKRRILSEMSSIFDPLGLCLPVTINGKVLMKELWSRKVDWDQPLDTDIKNSWLKLAEDLNKLESLKFQRNVLNDNEPVNLYIFSDASKHAYGFIAYAVQGNKSNIIMAKSKITPIKKKTLPTLELLGVHTAFNCLNLILKGFSNVQVNEIYIAVDAQVVLTWLLTDIYDLKIKNKFAINRLKEIKLLKQEIEEGYSLNIKYKYVSSEENPADSLSRGLTFDKFKNKFDFWTKGPEWLQTFPVIFPKKDLNCLNYENKILVSNTLFCNNSSLNNIEPLVAFNRFSCFHKLVRSVAFVFKFIHFNNVNIDETSLAKTHLIKVMQKQAFPDEIEYLLNPSNKNPTNLVKNLNLFLDEHEIIRSGGRIAKTLNFDYDIKHPILIGKDHDLSKLIIRTMHQQCKHLGLGTTLTKLRNSGFWIPKARQSIKKVLSECYVCKKFNSFSFRYPKVCNLPRSRVNFIRAFREVGIDYTGHIWVQSGEGSIKFYLLVFTCLHIRAIHIEIVDSMSTKSFIQALIRFINSYGVPSCIYSDNARSFISAFENNIIQYHVDSNEFKTNFQTFNIKHKRIPLFAPWIGAIWERMIRVIKSCIYKSVGRNKLNYFDLFTLISDIKCAINNRPLTYRCSNDNDLEIITPNSFLRPNTNNNFNFEANIETGIDVEPPSRTELIETLEIRDEVLNKFKKLWYEDYLISLRESSRDLHQLEYVNKIKINDVVLIKNPAKTRPYWLLGRVTELICGEDGKVRIVKLKRGDGENVTHSIKHLYPMELSVTHDCQPVHPVQEAEATNLDLNSPYADLTDQFSDSFEIYNEEKSYNGNNIQNSSNERQGRRIPKIKRDSSYYYY